MPTWFGQRRKKKKTKGQRGGEEGEGGMTKSTSLPQQTRETVQQRVPYDTVHNAFWNAGLVRKDVFAQKHPQFSKDQIDRFYDEDPVVRQYYGGKRETKKSEQRVTAAYNLHRIQMDLAEFRGSEFAFCLIAIDCYSRYVWVKKLRSKSAESMVPAVKELCEVWTAEKVYPSHDITILVDAGREYFNIRIKRLLASYNIGLYKLQSSISKAVMAENFIRHLRHDLNMKVLAEGARPWFELIDSIITNYNNTPHRGIFMSTPHEIYYRNPAALMQLQTKLRLKKSLAEVEYEAKKALQKPGIRRLDFVRVMTLPTHIFAKKSDQPPVSREIFSVKNIKPANARDVTRLPMYRLQDMEYETIDGGIVCV